MNYLDGTVVLLGLVEVIFLGGSSNTLNAFRVVRIFRYFLFFMGFLLLFVELFGF